ncbi:DUF397 domain-containing protein [Streptomyces caelestis]|uniref:DUF397 domain-containing protein n=1 Tax=Streptomyces caelestis TaxID=36816 RepID=UPI00381C0081
MRAHVSSADGVVGLTESAGPEQGILATTPAAFATLLRALKARELPPRSGTAVTHGPGDLVQLNGSGTVATTRQQWDAFVRGVLADESDRFAAAPARKRSLVVNQ